MTAKALCQLVWPPSLALVIDGLGCDSNVDVSPLIESHLFSMLIGQRIFNTEDLIQAVGTITRTSNIRREQPLLIRCCQAGRIGTSGEGPQIWLPLRSS